MYSPPPRSSRQLLHVLSVICLAMGLHVHAIAQPIQGPGCTPGDRFHRNVRIRSEQFIGCNDCQANPPDVLLDLLHKYRPILRLSVSPSDSTCGGAFGTLSLQPNIDPLSPATDLSLRDRFSLEQGRLDMALVASDKISNLLLSTRNHTASIKFATTPELNAPDVERMRITPQGFVGINTSQPKSQLHVLGDVTVGVARNTRATPGFNNRISVDGIVLAKEVRVTPLSWADDVFGPDYVLPSLTDVESHIREHRHLKGIPSEQQAITEGVDVAVMQAALLRKVEELTLYVIELEKKVARLTTESNGAKP